MSHQYKQALEGIRVLDISNLIAGPGISTNLADFGADVIKVEHPKAGDYLRSWGAKKNGIPLAWKMHARGKRLLAVDMHKPEGQQIIKTLAAGSDLMIENFRPGKLEQWGLGYDVLSAQNKKLILVRVTGWGQTGPYKERPGFGTLAESVSGFAHITGQPDGPPTLPPFGLADGVTALVGTYAVMMALYYRDTRNGPGQVIDLSIYEPFFSILGPQAIEYDQLGIVQGRTGNRSPRGVPRNSYETADGRWVSISAASGNLAFRVFKAIGREDMVDDPNYGTAANRLANGDEIDAIIAAWIKTRPLDEVLATFEAHQVPMAPIYDIAQIMQDPQYRARNTVCEVADEDFGVVKMANIPPRLSLTPGRIRHAGRTQIGHDTMQILKEAGFSDKEIRGLDERGIVKIGA